MDYKFTPDPNDRSPNNPAILLSSKKIMDLHEEYEIVCGVKSAFSREDFEERAKREGWGRVEWIGNQCLLVNTNLLREE